MNISSVSTTSIHRPVNPTKSGRDRLPNNEPQAINERDKVQERVHEQRVAQQRLEQNNEDSQRRLDGRLISFGEPQDQYSNDEDKQLSFSRSRVNEAYSPPKNEVSNSHKQQADNSPEQDHAPIDIVV